MIPIRDVNPIRTRPVITWVLILVCGVVFLYEATLPDDLRRAFFYRWALVPARLSAGDPEAYVTVLTSMFLHGGLAHVVGNLWFLRLFGDNVEDAVGRVRYLVLYLVSGVIAAAAQYLSDPFSDVPMLGASGAIGGVLGAYLVLFPHARIVAIVPIFVFVQFVEWPAMIFLLLWLLVQVVGGFGSVLAGAVGGVAYWAHVGGFVAGMLLGVVFRPVAHGVPQDRHLVPGEEEGSWVPPWHRSRRHGW